MANNTILQNENDLYSALPLRDDMIRVIDVHQNHTPHSTTANTLSGQLRVLALSDKPKFVALSYSWGSKGKDESPYNIQIYASGGIVEISIPETAYQAISDVRDHYEGQLTLWIDTICINQNDNSEKEIQIPLMREIYSNAEIVYVHLGRTESIGDAFDWMTYVSQRCYRGTGILGPGGWGGAAKRSVYTLLLMNFWTGKELEFWEYKLVNVLSNSCDPPSVSHRTSHIAYHSAVPTLHYAPLLSSGSRRPRRKETVEHPLPAGLPVDTKSLDMARARLGQKSSYNMRRQSPLMGQILTCALGPGLVLSKLWEIVLRTSTSSSRFDGRYSYDNIKSLPQN
jgi:hypothetical protein